MPALPVKAVRPIAPERLAALRGQASTWLAGPGATAGHASRVLDAMSVLHALASSPDSAPDALTLRPVGAPDRSVVASLAGAPGQDLYLVCWTIVGDPWAEQT